MRERTMSFLRQTYPVIILLVLMLLLFLTNFQIGTWLSGWDNLHPEFNFALNVKRSLFAVWQEYQGLGLLGGMGHASDLIRQIILWFFSLFIPLSLLRYFYHFAMLFLGAFGLYFLLKNFILENFEEDRKKIASLAGAVFYLFNLATIQMFYVPFEAYSAHFAALPWLFWVNLNFLKSGNRKSLVWLVILNLLFLTQGYVATFFVVYLIALSLVCLFWFFQHRNSLKRILTAALLVLSINAFWLLPNLYFATTSAQINAEAKINQMSTEDNLLKDKKYGALADTTLLKGFWFDNVEIDENGNANYQFKSWREHLQKPYFAALGYFLFTLCLIGTFLALIKKEKRVLLFLPVFLLAFLFLSNNTPFFAQLASLFYKIPLLKQIFRFPYTKFAILTAFCLALFYAYFAVLLIKLARKKVFQWIVYLAAFSLPIIYLFPIFQGHLFYQKERANIPQEYFQVMDFFKNQDKNTRIADFPQSSFWGWYFYRFNYSGSGFIWYGIKQPILDRTFDPWSDKNENYYWEITYALYSKNLELFEKVLEKYQINWLLVDHNIISPASSKALYLDELEEMLGVSHKVQLVAIFGNIKIYKASLKTPVNHFVFLAENLLTASPSYKWNNFDQAYFENGTYISQIGNWKLEIGNSVYYPFRSLFSGRTQDDLEFVVEDQENSLIFKKKIPSVLAGWPIQIPEIVEKELVWIDPHNLNKTQESAPEVSRTGEAVEVKVPKIGGLYSAEIDPTTKAELLEEKNCNQFSSGEVKNEIVIENGQRLLRQIALNANNCNVSFWLPDLSHDLAYLVSVQSQYQQGKSLLFWLENLNARKADIETYLPKEKGLTTSYFVIPPMEKDGLGYSLHFDNVSIGQEKSINDLGQIGLYPIPYRFLTQLKLAQNLDSFNESQASYIGNVSHPNPSLYEIHQSPITNHQSPVLVLSQAYHQGWQAYIINEKWSMINGKLGGILTPVLGRRIEDHLLINNWENGWALKENLKPNEKLVIIFLPQYLEYFGFLLLVTTLVFLLVSLKNHPKDLKT